MQTVKPLDFDGSYREAGGWYQSGRDRTRTGLLPFCSGERWRFHDLGPRQPVRQAWDYRARQPSLIWACTRLLGSIDFKLVGLSM